LGAIAIFMVTRQMVELISAIMATSAVVVICVVTDAIRFEKTWWRAARRLYEQLALQDAEIVWRISDEGLYVKTPTSEELSKWEAYKKFRESPTIFNIYYPTGMF